MVSRGLFIAFLFSLSIPVWAGPGSTGGGNAVVCFDDRAIADGIRDPGNPRRGRVLDEHLTHITSIQMYDLYEAENGTTPEGRKFRALPVEKGESRQAYIHRLRDRMFFFVPEIGIKISDGEQSLPSSHIRVVEESIPPTNDVLPDSDGKPECVLVAMAVQTREGQAHSLKIDGRLFNHRKHDPLSQNILFLHEYIYSGAMDNGKTDSRAVRLLIGRIIAQDGVMLREFEAFAADLGFLKKFDSTAPWRYPHYSYAMCRWDFFLDHLFREAVRLGFQGNRELSWRVADWMGRAREALKKRGRAFGCGKRLRDCEDELSYLGDSPEIKALLDESAQLRMQFAAKPSLLAYYKRFVKSVPDFIPGVPTEASKPIEDKVLELVDGLADSLESIALVETAFDSEDALMKSSPVTFVNGPSTYAVWGWTDYGIPSSTVIPPVADGGTNPKMCFWPEE